MAILLTTGATEATKLQNIYDIAGNVWEWTLERTSNTVNPCAYRGGNFDVDGSNYPVSHRSQDPITGSGGYVGFRVSIY